MTNTIPKTHVSVEDKGFPFNVPSVGDIVKAFGKHIGFVTEDFRTEDNPNAPMEVVRLDTNTAMMVFENELKVIAKPRMRVMEIEVNWQKAKNDAIQAAFEFSKMDW